MKIIPAIFGLENRVESVIRTLLPIFSIFKNTDGDIIITKLKTPITIPIISIMSIIFYLHIAYFCSTLSLNAILKYKDYPGIQTIFLFST